MAARIRKTQLTESWKEKIRTSMLINRLNNHIFDGEELSSSQLRAIEILLKKVAPDLKAVELSADDDTLAAVYGWAEDDTTSV